MIKEWLEVKFVSWGKKVTTLRLGVFEVGGRLFLPRSKRGLEIGSSL